MEASKACFLGLQGSSYEWAIAGGFITGTYWNGCVQFIRQENIPLAASAASVDPALLHQPHFGATIDMGKSSTENIWQSEEHGYDLYCLCELLLKPYARDNRYVVDVCWSPTHKRLIFGCDDGSIIHMRPQVPVASGSEDAMETDTAEKKTLDSTSDNQVDEDQSELPPGKRPKIEYAQAANAEAEKEEEAGTPEVIYRHAHAVEAIACADTGSAQSLLVASANSIGQIVLLDVNYREQSTQSLVQWGHCTKISALTMSNQLIASAAIDASLNIWDMRLKPTAVQIGTNRDGIRRSFESGDSGFKLDTATSLVFSPHDLHHFFVGQANGSVLMFDLRQTHTPVGTSIAGTSAVRSIQVHPIHGHSIAYGSDDGFVRVLTFEKQAALPSSQGVSHPTSQRAVEGAVPSMVGKTVFQYKHADQVRGIAWNTEIPHELVSASWDHTVLRHHVNI